MGKVRIGCSGWVYKDWRGIFYPEDLPQKKWFSFYAEHFDTVEINNSFYRLPKESTFESWSRQAPEGFRYAVKASRYLTHNKKLKDPADPLQRFLTPARKLGEHLGPLLYQLPPNWKLNLERLETFLECLPDDLLHVVEFRDQSWLIDEVYELLDANGVGFCTHDIKGLDVPRLATGPLAYVRFHGTSGDYHGRYGKRSLSSWVPWIREQAKGRRSVWAYFNNDYEGHAIEDARDLKEMVE